MIIASAVHLPQRSKRNRLYICIPLFAVAICLLLWQMENEDGFQVIWQYFGWSNQTLATFMLWAVTVYLVRKKKPYVITLLPALFMTAVCSTYLFISKQAFGMKTDIAYFLGGLCTIVAVIWFVLWLHKYRKLEEEIGEMSQD